MDAQVSGSCQGQGLHFNNSIYLITAFECVGLQDLALDRHLANYSSQVVRSLQSSKQEAER